AANGSLRIAVPMLPRIANFDDLDPLRLQPDVRLDLVPPGRPLPTAADLIILPGSKSTIADLLFLRAQGWDIDVKAHYRRGGWVLGLCGGYQMLGTALSDPEGIEGPAGATQGLGLLEVTTVLGREKTLVEADGRDTLTHSRVRGYEMHMGQTSGPDVA